jgi:hypothetical protein
LIKRYEIDLDYLWDYGPEGSEQYATIATNEHPEGEWVRWDDVKDLLDNNKKNERTENYSSPAADRELGKG